MRIVKVMVLVVAIALVPLSVGLVMLKQQQNAQNALEPRADEPGGRPDLSVYQGVEDQARGDAQGHERQTPVLNLAVRLIPDI